jgi:phospho-N-acetylmuramoyl-pentapeptide-transferase
MFYYLFNYLDTEFSLPGAGMFQYISFRAALSVITSLVITILFGKKLITFLKRKQVRETVRDLGLKGQKEKQGTPTMGGLIILGAILIPALLFTKLDNIYIILIIISTVWLGIVGFIDDYIKVFKKDKKGLAAKFKILGQIGLGLIIGITMYFSDSIVIKEKHIELKSTYQKQTKEIINNNDKSFKAMFKEPTKSMKTTIPFIKNNEFDYSSLLSWLGDDYKRFTWIIFIPIVILIVCAVSNSVNITDGLDGLATSSSAIIGATLGILAWVSGNTIFADYLNIMYIPDIGELTVFVSAFIGACIGFMWYNSYPAQIFMGDTGSLTIGGIIAVIAIIVRKELLLPLICGIFLIETLSVIIQVGFFKYTKKKNGIGRRVFLMSPLHHHFQKQGYHESKIVIRFWIIGILLAILSLITLKIR